MPIVNKGGKGAKKSGQEYFAWVNSLKGKDSKVIAGSRKTKNKGKASKALREAAIGQRQKRLKKSSRAKKITSQQAEPGGFKKVIYVRVQALIGLMLIFGQLPFWFYRKKTSITIRFSYICPIYWVSILICCFNWVIFIFLIWGLSISSEVTNKKVVVGTASSSRFSSADFEDCLAERFWLGYWIIMFILLHVAVSSTEFVCRAKSITRFLKELFQVIEEAQMDLTEGINTLIISNLLFLVVGLLLTGYLYTLKAHLPWTFALSYILVKTILRPIFSVDCDPHLFDASCSGKNYTKMAPYGLALIMYAVIASRLYTIYFMVICRIFSNAFYISTRRMEICLQLDSKKAQEEPIHVSFENMLIDYYNISTMVHTFNVVHGYSAATYFFIQLLGFLCECFALSRYLGLTEKDHRSSCKTGPEIPIEPKLYYKGLVFYTHLAITLISCMYVNSYASQVYRRILQYSAVLYRRGIVGFRQPEERDFVRTMWMNCSHRHPVLISPARLFALTPQFMIHFVGITVIYLIMMFPIPLLETLTDISAKQESQVKSHSICCMAKEKLNV